MLKIGIGLIGLFCSGFLNAQILISGKVTNAQQNILPGATIELITPAKTLRAISNDAGNFEIKSMEKNVHAILRCSYIGKKIADIPILLNKNQQVDFQLDDASLFLKPLEIQSVRASDRAPFTITNIKTSSLAQKNLGQDLPFLLNQLPSVTITSDAGNGIGYTGIRIRGTDATRINVTLNGIPYNDAESQGTYFVDIP
ncbi:MAG: carboxypeptidase-like regulatory domain-containing protein, partial [Chitinophagaceae bacterium]